MLHRSKLASVILDIVRIQTIDKAIVITNFETYDVVAINGESATKHDIEPSIVIIVEHVGLVVVRATKRNVSGVHSLNEVAMS